MGWKLPVRRQSRYRWSGQGRLVTLTDDPADVLPVGEPTIRAGELSIMSTKDAFTLMSSIPGISPSLLVT